MMINVLFVCHGNICRSPMAESVCAYLIRKRGLSDFIRVESAAAHTDELGNPPHYGTRRKLEREHIPLIPHRARLMTEEDGNKFDFLIGMDAYNVRDMRRIVGEKNAKKVKMLLDFTSRPRAIADPWYTGDFDETFQDIIEGCMAFLDYLQQHEMAEFKKRG